MLSDGTNAFTWNARNQVASLNSVSLQYDAFGRRIQNAAGKSFLYDGANAAQELSGSTVLANLLSGGIDEMFARSDSSGTYTPLQDALGSTIALVDGSGNIATAYAYDPFGNTAVSGLSNSNAFQYTGRENEGNGLYFYRARYYSTVAQRFVSEDPLGFGGGINFYNYAGSSPTNFVDPSGLDYTVQQASNGTILVTVPITFYGNTASPELARSWQKVIGQEWNGHSWKGCQVLFSVPVIADPQHEYWITAEKSDNMVYVRPEYKFQTSYTWDSWLGFWWNDASPRTIQHEFGHLLGLDDEYNKQTMLPKPGWETDIMAQERNVTFRDLDKVLAGRACACSNK